MEEAVRNAGPILIAGGGIGGTATALALARAGVRAVVLEQALELTEVGAGIQLGPNAFRVFRRLGIEEAVRQACYFPQNLILKDALTGGEVTRIPLGEPFLARFGHPYAVIHRADLLAAIVEACRAEHRIELATSRRVVSFTQSDRGVVVQTEDGSRYDGAALIGCDGVRSRVREIVKGDGPPRISGHIAYRAMLPIEEVSPEVPTDSVVLWGGPNMHLAHYPLRGGTRLNMGAIFHSRRYEEGWNSYGDPEELHEHFRAACAPVKDLVGRIVDWRMWVLCDRDPAPDWCTGRVTLLGDAAHPMLQYLAQGACMAMEDAVCVADALAAHAGDVSAAFRSYEAKRYPRTARVQVTARYYGQIYHADGYMRDLRNDILSARTPVQAYESLAWLYDGP